MYTFLIALAALIIGFIFYGAFVEKVFHIQPDRPTPALAHTDGVDYVPMSSWRIFLVQFLNIAGLGPIYGAIMGICFGPAAFLWIVLGTIFAGGVHDYIIGMISVRRNGASLPEIVGEQLGNGVRIALRLFTPILLSLLTTVFLSGPADLLQELHAFPTMQYHNNTLPIVWILIIFGYYTLATVLPVDKLIGRFYPVFGGILLFMGLGIMVVMLGWHNGDMIEFTDGLQNRNNNGLPLFPMMFVSIACGAISGFHATQSPLMARCLTNERQGRWIFYAAMACEGILALIWAAAAGAYQFEVEGGQLVGINEYLTTYHHTAADVVDLLCRSWLGRIGGILAIIGVIAAPVTSGDTALRSARLVLADFMHLDQKNIAKRFIIAIPLFAGVFGMVFVDFTTVWRYFSWTNQTMAVFTLWGATLFLYKQEHNKHKPYRQGYLITLIPALFMTMVSISYIMIAPEGLHLPAKWRWLGYTLAAVITCICVLCFYIWARKSSKKS